MADQQRRLILGNGEQYLQLTEKPPRGRPTEPPRAYADARELVAKGLRASLEGFESLPAKKKVGDEAVFCLRLHPDITAKSYDPIELFKEVPDLRSVGSRNYHAKTDQVAQTKRITKMRDNDAAVTTGRLVFVQSSTEGFQRLLLQLDKPESKLTKGFREEIRRIERFDTLSAHEQILGFEKNWREGRVELVLHPSLLSTERQLAFILELLGEKEVESVRTRVRAYPTGPTFVSCRLTRKELAILAGTNPLRAAHPLSFGGLTDLRSAPTAAAPKPPASATRSTIKIGMFDGGVDLTSPLLQGHVEEDLALAIGTPPDANCVAHGTAVAGALLYGQLNGLKASDRLPTPPVFVVSFRALPTSDPADIDLYESIDVIEKAVPARTDIGIFNVSFGPKGPIQDDTLSRFTYVLDSLAVANKVTFFVAVGNDGDEGGLERIQAPSDLVHGLGIGAFTIGDDGPIHATYSCHGPGRECGKIKPDVAAFGGCDNTPFHLVSTTPGKKCLHWGTSFASPLAARLGGLASHTFDRSSALLGRALLVHTAIHPDTDPDHLLGHGCILPTIDDVLHCEDKIVTVVFQSDILPKRVVRLPIPWPSDIVIPGKVKITWTIGALSPVNPNHPGDYTSCCVEETFYPDSKRFLLSPPVANKAEKPKVLHLDDDAKEIAKRVKQGWKPGLFPVSESGNEYKNEQERRLDCKWEPLVRRSISKYAKSIHDPFLTLHAIARNGASDRFSYVTIVTMQADKFDGDLYTEIRKRFPALLPIRLRTEAEIRVQI